MRFCTIIFLLGLLSAGVSSQTSKPKPTPSKSKAAASASKAKTTAGKPKSSILKAKTSASSGGSVPKSAALDETTEWERASKVADGSARVAALRKFIRQFPKSSKNAEAIELIVTVESQLGNDKLAASDVAAAVELYKAAARDAAKPISDKLFAETLSKIPANLYFRGARSEALEIANILEEKSDTSVGQLLKLSTFYVSIENGSEAKRLAENAIKLTPNSSAAYQALGLADRMDFDFEASAAAYTKALELEPDSLPARRGLAEMKRSLGKAEEAVTLYREILAGDEANVPARTGLILSLFDAGKRADAEAELTRSMDANPGNVILLASAAYWYAAHDEGEKAVDLAQKAIAADPRFIWSHIALARGFLSRKDPVAADKTLLVARRYGNFPTLEYEIASAKLAAGYYREAADELAKSFSVKDGVVHVSLGGRVPREATNFTELVGPERRASIFAPVPADSPENAAKLAALLKLKQELDAPEPKPEAVAKAVDDFIEGDDRMKVHRQIFAATQLLEKKVALPKVVQVAKAATANVEAGLDIPNSSLAVMAGELYENRSLALTRGEYLTAPDIPSLTLSAIIRGEIEELSGWALFQMDDPAGAVIRLKRAVSVLPVDSAWWRSSTWRLGTALAQMGKDAEALDMYIKSYKSSGQTPIRYNLIEALYKKVNGTTDGLEAKIGPNPAPPQAVALKAAASPTPELKLDPQPATKETKAETIPAVVPTADVNVKETARSEPTPIASAGETRSVILPDVPPKVSTNEPQRTPEVTKTTVESEASPKPALEETKSGILAETLPKPTPDETKSAIVIEPKLKPTPLENKAAITTEASPKPAPEEIRPAAATDDAPRPAAEETKPAVKIEPMPKPALEASTSQRKAPEDTKPIVIVSDGLTDEKTKKNSEIKPADDKKELFPPVVIVIPTHDPVKLPEKDSGPDPQHPLTLSGARPEDKTEPAKPEKKAGDAAEQVEVKQCSINLSEENITLHSGGGDLAVIVGLEGDDDVDGITAIPSNPGDIRVRREPIAGVKARALFVVRSISDKAGIFQIKFELPCGKKTLLVRVL